MATVARAERKRCQCGRAMSRYSEQCKPCHAERMATLKAEARRIVATGTCPDCGTALIRNSSLTGWWQCGASGSQDFRKPEYRNLPPCSFQTFTE